MADPPPKSRPEPPPAPPKQGPSVYGGRWSSSGAPDEAAPDLPDRPTPITTPKEETGWPDPENSAPTND